MNYSNLQYKIALTFIPNLGPKSIRNIISYLGDSKAIFFESKSNLFKIKGIGPGFLKNFNKNDVLHKAEKQLEFIEKNKITPLFFQDDNYPKRLLECVDAPIMLYMQGNCNLNNPKIISVVGTRKATEYGKSAVNNLIREISYNQKNTVIISGLAYGIDISAHKAAMQFGLPTIAILGHGLEKIYPFVHTKYANEIKKNGALISEYPSGSKILPSNFIQRNRIIAGMADATIIAESGNHSGALSTAYMANSYHREVFAFPGKITDSKSSGCNNLIKKNAARLIESVKDLEYILKWDNNSGENNFLQKKMVINLSPEEEKIYTILKHQKKMHIDEICNKIDFTMSKAVSLLLKLEFDGVIKSLPGKNYCLLN